MTYINIKRRILLISLLNNFVWRVTDCSWTFDFMCSQEQKVRKILRECDNLDVFEVALNLNENGIKHLMGLFFNDIPKKDTSLWNKKLINDLYDILNEIKNGT